MDLTGLLTIDGLDAYTAYGAVVVEGGHKGLLRWPPLKEVETNDWHEHDGIEADLTSPVLDSKEFGADFYFMGQEAGDHAGDFVDALRDGSYHTFDFSMVGRTAKLRAVSFGEPEILSGGIKMTVTFADDFPLSGYSYLVPQSGIAASHDYTMDGFPLTIYGVRVIEGTLRSARKFPDVKKNLLRDIRSLAGVIYDDPGSGSEYSLVKLSFREISLKCFLRAESLEAFRRNYDALLHDMTKPGARLLTVRETSEWLHCHYLNSEVDSFSISDEGVRLAFTMTLRVIGWESKLYLLGKVGGKYLTTLSGAAIRIKM